MDLLGQMLERCAAERAAEQAPPAPMPVTPLPTTPREVRALLAKLWKAHQARWPLSSPQFRTSIRDAYQRGRNWDLTPEEYEFLTCQPCAVCDGPLGNGIALDRIDSRGDYTLDNVRPCCGPCNLSKGRKAIARTDHGQFVPLRRE